MSYILDALRRADSERERGAVPGLYAQQDTLDTADAPPARSHPVLVGAVVVLLLAVVGLLGWNWLRMDAPEAVVAAQAPPPPVPDPTVAGPALGVSPAPEPATAASPAPRGEPVRSAPRTERAKAPPAPPARQDTAAEPARTATSRAADDRAPAKVPAAPGSVLTPAPAEPARDERVYALDELPPNIRRELPQLSIGGASYSENAASRMLIINGQVFHERDKLAPNLLLERISLKSAVLDYKGYRYRISY